MPEDYKSPYERLVEGDPNDPSSMPELYLLTNQKLDGSELNEKEKEKLDEATARKWVETAYGAAEPEEPAKPRLPGMSDAENARYQAGDLRKSDGWERVADLQAHMPFGSKNVAQEEQYASAWRRGMDVHAATARKHIVAAEQTDARSIRDVDLNGTNRMQQMIEAELLAGAAPVEEPKQPWRKRAWHKVRRALRLQ
jgi:hypothetical protein